MQTENEPLQGVNSFRGMNVFCGVNFPHHFSISKCLIRIVINTLNNGERGPEEVVLQKDECSQLQRQGLEKKSRGGGSIRKFLQSSRREVIKTWTLNVGYICYVVFSVNETSQCNGAAREIVPYFMHLQECQEKGKILHLAIVH